MAWGHMRTIAVVNQKGGVGKTTTTVNLGHALALQGKRVMLVDLDPQGHLSLCLGLYRAPHEGIDSVLLDGQPLQGKAVSTRELLSLVPAGDKLGEFEQIEGGAERGNILRSAIQQAALDVDYLIFDCPPSAGLLVVNAVLAADDVLVPVTGDYLSLTGLAKLMVTIQRIEGLRDSPLKKWIFLSRYVARRSLSEEVRDKILQHFPEHLLSAHIREAAVLTECAGVGRSIFEYRAKSKSAEEFRTLADDLLQGKLVASDKE